VDGRLTATPPFIAFHRAKLLFPGFGTVVAYCWFVTLTTPVKLTETFFGGISAMKLSDRIEQMIHPVHGLPQELDNILGQWFGQSSEPTEAPEQVHCPRTNIIERDKDFVLSIELPGVSVQDVTVEAADDKLMISGEKKISVKAETEKLQRQERVSGKFERGFEFPTMVDFEKISAEFQLGVLTVTVPKSEKVLPRKIEINVS